MCMGALDALPCASDSLNSKPPSYNPDANTPLNEERVFGFAGSRPTNEHEPFWLIPRPSLFLVIYGGTVWHPSCCTHLQISSRIPRTESRLLVWAVDFQRATNRRRRI